jgi:hypothetical protein
VTIKSSKGQVEKQPFLDIRELKRRDVLLSGKSTTFTITRNGRLVGRLSVMSGPDGLSWNYQSADPHQEAGSSGGQIEIVDTACHFGSTRPWFRCPLCHKRVAILYFTDSDLICRSCGHFNYASQQLTALDYKLKQVASRRAKLGAGDMFFHKLSRIEKPKHIRYTTYIQRLVELHRLERDVLTEMAKGLL